MNNKSVTPGVFATAFTSNGQLIISENQPSSGGFESSISSYTINTNGTLTAISQSLPTYVNGNCWNVIRPNGKWVYVDNAGTFTVAGFSIAANGTLSPIARTIVSTLSDGVNNLDMTTSADRKYLFNLLSGTGAIDQHGNADAVRMNRKDETGDERRCGQRRQADQQSQPANGSDGGASTLRQNKAKAASGNDLGTASSRLQL